MAQPCDPTTKMFQAGLLAWILPGAGHWVLGQRKFALVFFLAISFPYLTGVAIGGVKTSVNASANKWLFLAELGVGGYTTGFSMLNRSIGPVKEADALKYISYYPASDVAQIYLAVAGLLNLLAILDALARAQTGGQPVFAHETQGDPSAAPGGGP